MCGAMMFGPIIGSVVGSWAPVVTELALGVTTTKPMESHIHCFGAPWLDVVGDHAKGRAVVSLDRCGGLLVSHLFQELSHGYRLTGVDVESSKLEEFGDVEDSTIVGWVGDVSRAEEMASNSTACGGLAEVGCIAVDSEYHVTPFVGEDSVGVCCCVIEEPFDELKSVGSW